MNNCCDNNFIRNHVHGFTGSTRIFINNDAHNHRFSGVSGPAISYGTSHVHNIVTRTDSTNHVHEICDVTGPAINVGNGRHVHFVRGTTTFANGHTHTYQFATLIENPIGN